MSSSNSQEGIVLENLVSDKYSSYMISERMDYFDSFSTILFPDPRVDQIVSIVEHDMKLASSKNSQLNIYSDVNKGFTRLIIQTHVDTLVNAFWRKLTIVSNIEDIKSIGKYLCGLENRDDIHDLDIAIVKHYFRELEDK